ncbi:MAG: 1-acyl-sn-glycerol-3-phosphate acyltransferase [Treponema sp.]|jgi:1-acyl-sn-glycerol-3-phosphate acyltransferase|nr:1-acyl-sn-glycerol-3-phosphate acyltransferase [Treponema sp.]
MELAKTVLAFVITGLLMILLIPVGCLVVLFNFAGLWKPAAFVMYKIAQGWARCIIGFIGCPMIVSGREHIPPEGGFCFVSNHVGIFDIVLALGYAGRPFGFIAKKELLLIPGLNMYIPVLGGLFIDRKQPRKALATINRGVENIKRGGGMLIFPEGTRSRGRGLGDFHPGSLKLATQSGAVIVPVAITGSYEVFEKRYRAHAAPVSISFLPPIHPEELPPGDRKQILSARVHDSIARELERLSRS